VSDDDQSRERFVLACPCGQEIEWSHADSPGEIIIFDSTSTYSYRVPRSQIRAPFSALARVLEHGLLYEVDASNHVTLTLADCPTVAPTEEMLEVFEAWARATGRWFLARGEKRPGWYCSTWTDESPHPRASARVRVTSAQDVYVVRPEIALAWAHAEEAGLDPIDLGPCPACVKRGTEQELFNESWRNVSMEWANGHSEWLKGKGWIIDSIANMTTCGYCGKEKQQDGVVACSVECRDAYLAAADVRSGAAREQALEILTRAAAARAGFTVQILAHRPCRTCGGSGRSIVGVGELLLRLGSVVGHYRLTLMDGGSVRAGGTVQLFSEGAPLTRPVLGPSLWAMAESLVAEMPWNRSALADHEVVNFDAIDPVHVECTGSVTAVVTCVVPPSSADQSSSIALAVVGDSEQAAGEPIGVTIGMALRFWLEKQSYGTSALVKAIKAATEDILWLRFARRAALAAEFGRTPLAPEIIATAWKALRLAQDSYQRMPAALAFAEWGVDFFELEPAENTGIPMDGARVLGHRLGNNTVFRARYWTAVKATPARRSVLHVSGQARSFVVVAGRTAWDVLSAHAEAAIETEFVAEGAGEADVERALLDHALLGSGILTREDVRQRRRLGVRRPRSS
jgi:hypothetical protein